MNHSFHGRIAELQTKHAKEKSAKEEIHTQERDILLQIEKLNHQYRAFRAASSQCEVNLKALEEQYDAEIQVLRRNYSDQARFKNSAYSEIQSEFEKEVLSTLPELRPQL